MKKVDQICNELSRVFSRHMNKVPVHEIVQDFMSATVYFAYKFSGKNKEEVFNFLEEILKTCKENLESE